MQQFADFFLSFSHYEILLPIIFLGFLFYPKLFLVPTLLLFLSMIFNPLLKSFFGVPFPPELVLRLGKEGLSFPSGHIQSSAVFYGWLIFINKNKIFRLALLSIIVGIAFGIIYNGYHNIYDVLAGILFAVIMIITYNSILNYKPTKNQKSSLHEISDQSITFISLGIACFLLFLLGFIYEIPAHSITSFYIIIGINIGLAINKKLTKPDRLKIISLIIISSLFCYLFGLIQFNSPFLKESKWILLAINLPILHRLIGEGGGNFLKNFFPNLKIIKKFS